MDERLHIQALIHRHLDQATTPEESAELDRLLGSSAEAADAFAEASRLDAFLVEHFSDTGRRLQVAALFHDRQPAAPRRRWRLPVPVLAAAAGVLLIVGALLLGRHLQKTRQPQGYQVVAGHVLLDGEARRELFAGARLVVPDTAPAVLHLPDGSRAELAPASRAILRGHSGGARQAIELLQGSGRFQVAKGTEPFRVETLLGCVTALGTEFTVDFGPVPSSDTGGVGMRRTAVQALAVAVILGMVQVDFGTDTFILSAGDSKVFAAGVRDGGTCGPPPPPKPAQRSGAEGVPPLPLPATPQRRTEKKKPPTPPAVVVKIKTGSLADWATDQNDINNLLVWMQTKLKINFSFEEKPLREVKLDASRLPMLYRTGHNAFTFSAAERQALRDYVLKGGFIYFDACCGRKAFSDSARAELAKIFPERPLRKLPPDHPLYRCYYDVPLVAYTPAAGITGMAPPPLEGIDIGCRTGVVFSPYDLSCGWDMHTHKTCSGVQAEYALKLGANLIAYATATKAMGTSLAESRVYTDREKARADKFRIGQVMHGGQWNPDPAGLSTLLDTVSSQTSLKVSFATQPLRLDSKDLTTLPFIYMTGHDDFTLSGAEVAALRAYLRAGGFLMGDACCGRKAFDTAFRREMAKVLPGLKLKALPTSHPLYSMHYKIASVNHSQAAIVQRKLKNPGAPALEGILVNGQLAVVYSPLDLGCGWELKPHPYGVGYESRDAIRLGVNVVMYAVSH